MATLDPLNITRGTHLKTKVPSEVIIRQHKVPSDLNRVFVLSNGTFIGMLYFIIIIINLN